MLKTSETYRVTVVLNDGQATVCTLLSKPDAVTLAAVASAREVAGELIEATGFARDLVVPILGADAVWTDKQAPSHRIDIFALFPTVHADKPAIRIVSIVTGNYCSSYQHIGQHGAADYHHCINQSRPATPEEYADLKAKLEGRGYTLRIIQRASYQHHEERR